MHGVFISGLAFMYDVIHNLSDTACLLRNLTFQMSSYTSYQIATFSFCSPLKYKDQMS